MKEEKVNHFKLYLWCFTFLKKYTFYVIAYFVLVAIQETCFILLPKQIQKFIDVVAISKDFSIVTRLVAYTVLIVAVIIIVRLLHGLCGMVFCEKGTKVIQYAVIDKARDLGYDYFEKTPRGDFLAKTYQNVLSVYFLYYDFIPNTMRLLCAFTLPMIMIILSKNIYFIATVLICCLCVAAVTLVSSRRIYNRNMEIRDITNLHYKKVYDCIESVRDVRGYNSGSWISKGVISELDNLNSKKLRNLGLEQRILNYVNFFQAVAIGTYFILGINNADGNFFSVGNIVAYYAYVSMAITALSKLTSLLINQNKNLTDAEKPYTFMHIEPTVKESENPTNNRIKGSITFNNVSFNYENQAGILNNLTANIAEGEKVVIVGGSGNGKTTILKLLLRCYDCCEGEILIDGVPIKDYRFNDLRNSFGIVFQEMFLFSETIKENLKFAKPDAAEDDFTQAVRLAEAHEFIENMKDGYDTMLGSRGENLSGGQRQRLSIARVILKAPQIYLLDEITSDLDSITEAKVMNNLFDISDGKTMLMVSHRLSVIKQFSRILVLNEGRIVEDGDFNSLFKEGTCFYNLVKKGVIGGDE